MANIDETGLEQKNQNSSLGLRKMKVTHSLTSEKNYCDIYDNMASVTRKGTFGHVQKV